jgi:hypothetical protein
MGTSELRKCTLELMVFWLFAGSTAGIRSDGSAASQVVPWAVLQTRAATLGEGLNFF